MKRKYGSIHDRSNDVSPPLLPPEPTLYTMNIPCIHSSILNDGKILLLPLFSSVYRVEQSDEVNTLINKVNEEYSFWRPHRDKEHPVDSIHANTKEEHHGEHHEDSIGVIDGIRQDILNVESKNYDDNYDGPSESKYQSSTEAVPTTTPASVIRTDIVSTETGSSSSIAVVAAATAADSYANDLAITAPGVVSNEDANSILIADDDDDNNSNTKLKLDGEIRLEI